MQLHGLNLIGSETAGGATTFVAMNPSTSLALAPPFHEAGAGDVERAMRLAESAFGDFRRRPARQRAAFLNAIAAGIEADDDVLQRANEETGLPIERLRGERGRTAGQLRLFARLIEEGSWVGARIDRPDPSRKPAPRPDLRRMLIAMGPVVVFAASNFPLAFSVAGGDTASALGAGCPVVVKTHPGHPGTSEIVGAIIVNAAKSTGMPAGVFSMLHGKSHALSLALVRHPLAKAVGFTGSLRAGRALFDAAAARPEPIPVYAEMGSTNPVLVLPGALAERGRQIAEGFRASVTLGVGQFCTNPGLVIGVEGDAMRGFVEHAALLMGQSAAGTMLYAGLADSFNEGVRHFSQVPGVRIAARSQSVADASKTQVTPTLFAADAKTYLANHTLREELFGPASLVVTGSREELERIAASLDGHLTATIQGTAQDLKDHRDLIAILERKVGRLLFNGFPTGVEVSSAMQHGGPYPATTDSRTTSVGTAAIERFARPLCYQDFPNSELPEELQNQNPHGIWRLLDGQLTRDPV
ncbi:MAG TPA: aldehyde dehydrogenase (NADP(+)) [Tepidisphaeraceae bacterium]|nr:aldehyde dehydrogenase (NADP(+)) [Tepidisphaeraceae bacterium]